MKLCELYEVSRVPLVLFDGTKITSDFVDTFGESKIDIFTVDYEYNIIVFPEGCYLPEDLKRCGL